MINTIFLQAGGGEGFSFILMLLGMLVIFFFFTIRPQMQRQKKEKKFQEEIKRGDLVVTSSGIHGKVFEINDDTVIIETGAGKIKFERTAISNELTAARYSTEVKNKA